MAFLLSSPSSTPSLSSLLLQYIQIGMNAIMRNRSILQQIVQILPLCQQSLWSLLSVSDDVNEAVDYW